MKRPLTDHLIVAAALFTSAALLAYLINRGAMLYFHALFILAAFAIAMAIDAFVNRRKN